MIEMARRADVMGIGIDNVREHEVVDHVFSCLDLGRGGRIVTPNVDILRQVQRDLELRRLLESADIVVADGAPVVWASHIQGTPLSGRIAGATMVWSLSAGAAATGRRVFLLGGTPGTGPIAAARLQSKHPGLVCDWHSPPYGFERSKDAITDLVSALATSRPDVVFCGFGFPKQERLMQRLAGIFPATWFCGVGAGIGFAAGEHRRAPVWMQQYGLEWLYRLGQEPQRLFARYIVHDVPFAVQLLGHAVIRRWELAA
jgi:N-acetylglucosaminyldiphosphoundecaprenol N-acetyl-beta-D-mannosaminyltransferase